MTDLPLATDLPRARRASLLRVARQGAGSLSPVGARQAGNGHALVYSAYFTSSLFSVVLLYICRVGF